MQLHPLNYDAREVQIRRRHHGQHGDIQLRLSDDPVCGRDRSDGDKTSATEEPRTAIVPMPDATTPLPSTPTDCSTSHGSRPTQRARAQDTAPIRATVVAEKMSEKERVDQEKNKSELPGLTEKKEYSKVSIGNGPS